jgi:hypothetical protein
LGAFALSLSLMVTDAPAAVEFVFEEAGGNVVGTLSGSLDLTGATPVGDFSSDKGAVLPRFGILSLPGDGLTYAASGPGDFGQGFPIEIASSASGSSFLAQGNLVGVPIGYSSGQSLSGTMTFLGASFVSLGIDPGTYAYTLQGSNDTVTLRFGTTVVPLPAALPLMLGALGLAFAAVHRRS